MKIFEGIPAASGIVSGTVCVLDSGKERIQPHYSIDEKQVHNEIRRFKEAVGTASSQLSDIISSSEEEFNKVSMLIIGGDFEESLERGELADLLKKRNEANKNSYFIDEIINKILPKVTSKDDYFFTELQNLNRFQRRLIADNVWPKYLDFINGKNDFRCPFISFEGLNIMFLFSRKLQDVKENENMLITYTGMMKKKHNVNKIIGISEHHYSNGMINHNFCSMDGEIEFDETNLHEDFKKQMQDTSKIKELKNIYEFDL